MQLLKITLSFAYHCILCLITALDPWLICNPSDKFYCKSSFPPHMFGEYIHFHFHFHYHHHRLAGLGKVHDSFYKSRAGGIGDGGRSNFKRERPQQKQVFVKEKVETLRLRKGPITYSQWE